MSQTATETMLRISSDPSNISMVESFVDQTVQGIPLTQEKYGDIVVSVTEAVNNAIIHGNRQDIRKKVLVRAEKNTRQLAFVVEDEGRGFDFRKLDDPTKDENITKIGGRGVWMLHHLCDAVRYEREGCCVELRFKIA